MLSNYKAVLFSLQVLKAFIVNDVLFLSKNFSRSMVVWWWCGGGAVVVRWWCGGGAVVVQLTTAVVGTGAILSHD